MFSAAAVPLGRRGPKRQARVVPVCPDMSLQWSAICIPTLSPSGGGRQADRPEHQIRLQSPAQAGDFLILPTAAAIRVMFVTHRAHSSSLYLDKGITRIPQSWGARCHTPSRLLYRERRSRTHCRPIRVCRRGGAPWNAPPPEELTVFQTCRSRP